MSVDRKEFDELAARVAALEARLPSSGALRLTHVEPEPMPAQAINDPDGAIRAEIVRLRKTGITWEASWHRIDLDWIQRGLGIYAQTRNLKTDGYRDFIEAPLRAAEAAGRAAA
jgi:hypothetical protein